MAEIPRIVPTQTISNQTFKIQQAQDRRNDGRRHEGAQDETRHEDVVELHDETLPDVVAHPAHDPESDDGHIDIAV